MSKSGSSGNSKQGRPKTARQKAADDTYAKAIEQAERENPNVDHTGYADPLKVATGSSLADAGFNQDVRDAKNEQIAADMEARNMRPDGTQRPDDKPNRAVAPAAVAPVQEEEEEEEEEAQTPVEEAQENVQNRANTTVSAEAANRPRTQAETEAKDDKDRGYKSGTVATSPSGIPNEDTSGLRPKQSAFRGLLVEEDPKKKKTLIA